MADRVSVRFSKTRSVEGSQILVTVDVRAGSAAEVPTTLEYKIYNETRRELVKDWTAVTAAASSTITIPAELTSIRHWVKERFALIVAADRDLSTAVFGQAKYHVDDVGGWDYDDREYILSLLTEDFQYILTEAGERIQI